MSNTTYSSKDSNRNRKIEQSESKKLLIVISIMCALATLLISYYYFHAYHLSNTKPMVIPTQPAPIAKASDPIAPDESHAYDSSKPPHKQ
jgi:flagellar basal body-associated protein FliL